jgi:hypothetical protein
MLSSRYCAICAEKGVPERWNFGRAVRRHGTSARSDRIERKGILLNVGAAYRAESEPNWQYWDINVPAPFQSLKIAIGPELPFADALRVCLAPGAFPPASHGCMSRTNGAKMF